jgi:phage shock protein E
MLIISKLIKSSSIALAKTKFTTAPALLLSNKMSYEERITSMGLAKQDDIRKSLTNKSTILLDVRTMDEIAESGKIEVEGHPWMQTVCTTDSVDMDLNKDTIDKDADVVVYCRSGRRASRAKEILESKGFKNVLNGGGYDDMKSMGL